MTKKMHKVKKKFTFFIFTVQQTLWRGIFELGTLTDYQRHILNAKSLKSIEMNSNASK